MKQRTRVKNTVAPVKEVATVVNTSHEEEKTQTDMRVKTMSGILFRQPTKMPYFKFVVNPDSFTQTVENMFDLAFLVREKNAMITVEDGELILHHMKGKFMNKEDDRRNVVNSNVFSLNFHKFSRCIEHYNIQKSIVPTRVVHED